MEEIAPVDKLMAQIADAYESLSRQHGVAMSFAPYWPRDPTMRRYRAPQQSQAASDYRQQAVAAGAQCRCTVAEGSAFAFCSLTSTICLCQALFIGLAYKLELNIEEIKDSDGNDD
jgi:hypothetical protein